MPKFIFSKSDFRVNPLLKIVTFLILFSSYFMFNASVIMSIEIYGNPFRYGVAHIFWLLIGFFFMSFFYHININTLKKYTFIIYLLSFTLLFILISSKLLFGCEETSSFTPCTKGAVRWFYLNPKPLPEIPMLGVVSFQPSELAKLSLVLVLAYIFSSQKFNIKEKVIRSIFLSLPIILFVFFQPNKSTSVILFLIFAGIFYANGEKVKYLFLTIIFFITLMITFVFLNDYSYSRLSTFLNTNQNESENYHQKQIMISLGSGGFTGLGLGQSRQKFSFLPEISSDSIFAVIGEELGLIGSLLIIACYFLIIFLGLKISLNQIDLYKRFLGVGITCWIGVQSLINFFSMTGIIPLTGIPLPIISYGGSSTIFVMIGLGILLNLSKSLYEPETRK